MNDIDVKELFAAAVARPDVDRIDTQAVLRGGRRRARLRAAATAGSALAVLAVVGSLVVASIEGPVVIADPSPTATVASPSSATPPVAASPVPVTSMGQVTGTWYAVTLAGSDVTGYQVREGTPLAVRFGAQQIDDFWELNGNCNQEGGRYAIDASGRWTARYTGSITFVACRPRLDIRVQDAIDALTSATSATLEPDAGRGALLRFLAADGGVLAEWSSQASAPVDYGQSFCKDAVLTPGGSIADQDAVDAVADQVRAEAAAQPADNLSVLVVHPDRLAVDVFWVGVVPTFLTDLVTEQARKGLTINVIPARYTRAQMLAAAERALRVPPPAEDPASQGLTIGSASGCNDGSGIKVELAQDSNSLPAPSIPEAYAAAIQNAVGDIPVLVVPGMRPVPAQAIQR